LSLVLTQVQTSVTALCCTFLTLSPQWKCERCENGKALVFDT
jgi:hypothetical protein